ncbi:hypothetical protein K492DRAFT_204936 [Lichtheimia hyalospora FSU 10163]|nr:hypothetical protein K492DRAFT_204936 [Lichtheimia hyalospora FSU 10163]
MSVPLDLELFQTLESRANDLSNNLDNVIQRLQTQMRQMSSSTAESSEIYKQSIQKLSEEINECTGKTVELITQCDELDKDLAQLHTLSKQIKSIDKALDQLQKAI